MTSPDGATSPSSKDVVVEQVEKEDLVERGDVRRHQGTSELFVAAHIYPAGHHKQACITSPRRPVWLSKRIILAG